MSWTTVDGWAGRVWVSEGGKRTFYIRQVRDGKRWDVSTRCSTLRGALAELGRWEMNPEAYRPLGSGAGSEAPRLDAALIEEYAAWCLGPQGQNTDPNWVKSKKRYLFWWAERFDGKPLASVKLRHILECLKDQASRADRIKTLKHFYSWLRQNDRLTAAEDPTLDALPVPQARPSQDRKSKVISEADFLKVLPHLAQPIADICRFQAGTGCHLSEALRFIKTGEVSRSPGMRPIVGFAHKGGHTHRIEVSEETAQAAERLRASEAPARVTVYHAIARACRAAGVEPWTPGRFRHTFATRAIERAARAGGAEAAAAASLAVARYLGHTGTQTTLRWYATTAVAPHVVGSYAE